MSNKSVRMPTPAQRKKMPLSMETMNQMVALYNAGQWQQLEETAREATVRHPEHVFGWKALGKALLLSGRTQEALAPLERATKIASNDPDSFIDLGTALQNLGRFADAEKCYRQVVKLNPTSAVMRDTLGVLLSSMGRFAEAEQEIRRALALDPRFLQAHINLGYVSDNQAHWAEAEKCYRNVLAFDPEFYEAHRRLGDLLAKLPGRGLDAIPYLEKAIALNPRDANSMIGLANVLMAEKRTEESNAMYRRAMQIEPLITWPARQPTPEFRLLLLDTPGAGSTPMKYLAGRSSYECNFVPVLPDANYDLDLLHAKADVVFNMIADADNGAEILPYALELADKIDRPIVNHPRKIMATDREMIANKISGIPLARVPKTIRVAAETVAGGEWRKHLDEFSMPMLIRCAGMHGGDDFEKVDSVEGIDAFVFGHPDSTFYLGEYIDYQSADGYFRKYRVICLDGEVLPYHLAIHNHWMVHHFRTDMANQEWMRKEEEAFLKNMDDVFDARHQESLRAIGKATGLDYCGIDCSLDREGNIVVFETNATMLVHDEKEATFAYKNPYIAKIKVAFDAMLARMAAQK
ncbi:MAG: tetratricopeptide repeat protein [Burkholderiaceae bacterium]|nr:tetratricopeptide repeat protein [Burkholderiaceae bacterium]